MPGIAASLSRRLLLVLFSLPALLPAATEPPYAGPLEAGTLEAPPRNETSGLAASRSQPDLLWTHDDSGGAPVLYALAKNGARRGALRLRGVRNDDWEDLAACTLDGKAWLVVGDTGDNDAERKVVLVHFVLEPDPTKLSPGAELAAAPTATFRIKYEDGPRDCESVAVDERERALYLLSKRDAVPRLYRVALPAALADQDLTARFAGEVSQIPQPSALERMAKGRLGRQRTRPCGMDIRADGRAAVVVTYGDLLYFPRQEGETWAAALGRAPVVLPPHGLLQAEAVCFARDGTAIYVASEMSRRLLRYAGR